MILCGSPLHTIKVIFALVWNDLKSSVRQHVENKGTRARLLQAFGLFCALVFFILLHEGAFAILIFVATGGTTVDEKIDAVRGMATLIWGFLVFVMLSGGLARALVVLHEQDDSDLLLSAPISSRAILAGRLVGNALQSGLVNGFIIVPWLDVLIFTGHFNFIFGFLVWPALSLIVACCDAMISFTLVRTLGLRRARSISQVVPFLLIFLITFISLSVSLAITDASITTAGLSMKMPESLRLTLVHLGTSPLAWVPRASGGNPLYLCIFLPLAGLMVLVTLIWTEKPFLEASQHLNDLEERVVSSFPPPPFKRNLFYLDILKNLRLIARTPMILVQAMSQILAPVGISFVLSKISITQAICFFTLFALGVLSGILTIAAGTVETCDDLLQMSPRSRLRFRLSKMMSGFLLPVIAGVMVAIGLLVTHCLYYAASILLVGIPLALTSSLLGETFADPLPYGMKPKLLSSPIMIIPLLGTQLLSGTIAGSCIILADLSSSTQAIQTMSSPSLGMILGLGSTLSLSWPPYFFHFLALDFCYFLLILAVGLAQIRKPLF